VWFEIVEHFPKKSRYTLGNKIDLLFIESIELIFIASYKNREQKILYLQKAISKMDLLKFFLQISWDIKILENKKYSTISEPLNEIGRMLGGWIKQANKTEQ
jgi:hypothetical protein